MKNNLFKVVNFGLAIFCAGTMWMNHVDINITNNDKATSCCGGNTFEYTSNEGSFSVYKNGTLVGTIPTNKKIQFKSGKPLLQCNALVVAGKVIAAGIAAAATGGSFAAAAGAAIASAINAVGGGAMVGAAAAAAAPGAAAVEATIGGAGVAAAEAAATAAAAGAGMAALTAIIVPVLIGAGVGVGLT